MEMNEYIEYIKLQLGACGILELELSDDQIKTVVKMCLLEIQRYIDSTKLMTIPYARCIDLTDANVSSVSRIYRSEGFAGDGTGLETIGGRSDPMYAQMWTAFTNGGTMYNLQDYLLNYATYNTLLQIKNISGTDLSFFQDKSTNKLYIHTILDSPTNITIEYIPKYLDVNEIKSDYWIDIMLKLSTAMTKQVLGRLRSRYTLSNAQWTQDGERILEEANAELSALREQLQLNSQIIYPID